MASAAPGDNSNPYDGGLGTGGKFRKRPFRRIQTTPYDRPPTASRKAGHGNSNEGGGGGWFSKLVDPAQRLITYSAHRLFASVFRKRLPASEAPQQQQLEIEADQETQDVDLGGSGALPERNDIVAPLEDASALDDSGKMNKLDGITNLEQIVSQKTFTRSEIDRLTTLLRSKAVDASVGKEERSDVIHSRPLALLDRNEELPYNLARENGNKKHPSSTPLASSSVFDERIASPAELAKAYMGGKSSEISPSVLGLRGQVVREDSTLLRNRTPLQPRSDVMALVPRSSMQVAPAENGFVTPRSRGRSAVYNMARTPYNRPGSVKGPPFLSTSRSAWKETDISGSKQGNQSGSKRRNSVLENDIGFGPVRRIRQKSNLFSSKSLSTQITESLPAIRSSGGGFGSQLALSSKQEERANLASTSKDTAGNGSSFYPVPSKSSETASRILQQLDILVSAKDKSPAKLSASMLQGPARKSLQNVDSSKCFENFENSKLTGSPASLPSDAQESGFQKHQMFEENGRKKFLASSDKPTVVTNTRDAVITKDLAAGAKASELSAVNPVGNSPPPKKRAFRMSAYEDYLELDDDDLAVSASAIDERRKANASLVENNTSVVEPVKAENPLSLSEVNPETTYLSNGNAVHGTSNGSTDAGINTRTPSAAFAGVTVQSDGTATQSITKFPEAAESEQFNAVPAVSSSLEKVPSQKEQNSSPALITNSFSNSAAPEPLDKISDASLSTISRKPTSFTLGATGTASTVPNSDKNVDHSTSGSGFFSSSALSPGGGIFSSGSTAASSSINADSVAQSPSTSSLVSSLSSNAIPSQSPLTSFSPSFAATDSFGNISSSTSGNLGSAFPPALSSPSTAAPTFNFGASAPPTSSLTASASIVAPDAKESSIKVSTVANLANVPLADTSSSIPTTGISAFPGASSAITPTSTVNNIFGGTSSALGGTGNSISSSTSSILGSSGSTAFGVASSATTGTGSSPFSGTSSIALPSTGSNLFGGTSGSAGSSLFGGISASTGLGGTSGSTGSSFFGGTSGSTGSSFLGGTSVSTGSSFFGGTTGSIGSSPLGGTSGNSGSGVFGFSAGAVSASSQSQTSGHFGAAANAQMGTASTQSVPFQFGSSTSTAPSFGLSGGTSLTPSSSPFGSLSTPGASLFGSAPTSQPANSISSSGTSTSTIFGSNWQAPKSTPTFGSSFNSSSSASSFSFGGSSGSAPASGASTPVFGSTATTPSSPIFGFGSTPATSPSTSIFGNAAPGFTFGSNSTTPPNTFSGNNNDQMNMEDSMAEDTHQAKPTASVVPVFGQPTPTQPQQNFAFGASTAASPFQFGGQQNTAAPTPSTSPFQASGSLEFNGGGGLGGSFSLGSTSGADKSNRRIVKVNRSRRPKK